MRERPSMVRLGDLLVQRGALTDAQRDRILAAQAVRPRPFGALAEELFGISPQAVEQAWAEQYAAVARRIDPRSVNVEPRVLALIERRQAWQFGLIPIGVEDAELHLVTAPDYLARAMRFAGWRIAMPCTFSICDTATLATSLGVHYPIEGFDAEFVSQVMGQFAKAG